MIPPPDELEAMYVQMEEAFKEGNIKEWTRLAVILQKIEKEIEETAPLDNNI